MKQSKIIHKLIKKYRHYDNYNDCKYLCNEAVESDRMKMSYRWKDVTCKNCLRLKPSKNKKKWCGSCK